MSILDTHIFIEFYFAPPEDGLLYEQTEMDGMPKRLLFEKYGLFDGCETMAQEIEEYLWDETRQYSFVRNYHINFQHPIFHSVHIMRSPRVATTRYVPSESTIVGNAFEECTIHIPLHFERIANLRAFLCHELTHAYEDLGRRQHGGSLDFIGRKIGYDKNPISRTPADSMKTNVSTLLYHLTDFERNAYIAQIRAELLGCGKTFSNIDGVMEFLRKTDFYRMYQIVLNYAKSLCGIKDEETQENVVRFANELSNHNFRNYRAFVRWLKRKVYTYEDKFARIIPKMAFDYLSEGYIYRNGSRTLDFVRRNILDEIERYSNR